MKKLQITTLFIAFLSVAAGAQTKVDTLTNEKVIKLSKLGLQPSVVITKIQNSFPIFDVSTDGLISLSDHGVSPDVIGEMVRADTKIKETIASHKDMNDPLTKRETGIYLYNPKDTKESLKQVDPTVISTNKSGGIGIALAQAYTAGLAKEKVKSSLAGSKSRFQIHDTIPVFYFYFESIANRSADSWFFATATSPNEFVLVRLDENKNKNKRELIVANVNAYGGTSGVSDGSTVDFTYDKVSEGIYKLILKQPLEIGEYCFLYANATPTSFSNDKVFDFGISNGAK